MRFEFATFASFVASATPFSATSQSSSSSEVALAAIGYRRRCS